MTKNEALDIISGIYCKLSTIKGQNGYADYIRRACKERIEYLKDYSFSENSNVPWLLAKAAEDEVNAFLDIEPGEDIP